MCKSKTSKNMRKQENNTPFPPKSTIPQQWIPGTVRLDESPERDCTKLIIKMFHELKEELRKELRITEDEGHFNKEIEIVKRNQV